MKFAPYMAVSFITFFHIVSVLFCIIAYGCMLCMLLFNVINYVLLLCSVLGILFHCVALCTVFV
jgi:hypothetical protein